MWELRDATSQTLKIPADRVGVDENLADFGFDSISLAEFARELSSRFGFEVTPDVFFGYPTLSRLSGFLLESRGEELAAFYQEADADSPVARSVPVSAGVRRSGARAGGARRAEGGAVAIVGMSGRFPQARDVSGLWSILREGRQVVGAVPQDRLSWWASSGLGGDEQAGSAVAGFVPGVAEFDPLFFQISPREAETMDPRQRLLLQESWNALEDAGFANAGLSGSRVGVFVGAEEGDYQLLVGDEGSVTGNSNSILASRLSYFLNLDGPGMAINTSCSSGLVAVHQACQSLQSGECDVAVVAGVNLMLTSAGYQGMRKAGMLSEQGACRAFDRGADGMVPSEAVAVVVLKRLSAAEADGDPVYASIVGSGINYDGKTNGITAPSGRAQTQLLKDVYDRFGIDPERIGHIVTHGTGTRLGDPVEINALADAFKDYTSATGFCALTSTKPNVGHSLAASGVVSLISLVLGMWKEEIPASINCDQVNDYIRWDDSPFYVNQESRAWPETEGGSRVGAVSSFGMSGTNAHLVVQSYDTQARAAQRVQAWPAQPCYLLPLSAKTADALDHKIADMVAYLRQHPDMDGSYLSVISAELVHGRQHFTHRCVAVVKDRDDALHVLDQARTGQSAPNLFTGTVERDFTTQPAIQHIITDLANQAATTTDAHHYQELLYALADLYC
ncbi:beta-ketoacyl synthase N-terminal-like domain-containing protein, partial [Phytoactinopolyspora halophila]|uniref:beta-ketoacyl synthase N-terminal-like domain-containing protein n=1 Tax=Phytoactinopolyspora halophila TaxID=1981511 RepID=UPI001FE6E556